MKRLINILAALVITAGLLSISAQAQGSGAARLIASIPFAFNVGNKTLPAGRYTFTVVNPTSDRRILHVQSMDRRANVMLLTLGIEREIGEEAKVVFHRYGDRFFFAAAQMPGDSTTLAALKSKTEKAEKAIAKGKKSVVVIVGE